MSKKKPKAKVRKRVAKEKAWVKEYLAEMNARLELNKAV